MTSFLNEIQRMFPVEQNQYLILGSFNTNCLISYHAIRVCIILSRKGNNTDNRKISSVKSVLSGWLCIYLSDQNFELSGISNNSNKIYSYEKTSAMFIIFGIHFSNITFSQKHAELN